MFSRLILDERHGPDQVNRLAGLVASDDDERRAAALRRIQSCLDGAEGEITAALGGAFEFRPSSPDAVIVSDDPAVTPPALIEIGVELATVRLYRDVVPEALADQVATARRRLAAIAAGAAELVRQDGSVVPRRTGASGSGLARRSGPAPAFTDDTLAGLG